MEPFGWLNTVYDLAEKGIFNLGNKNSIDSVLVANCWQVMSYLQWSDKKNFYKEEIRKSQVKEQKEAQKKAQSKERNRRNKTKR